jgi:hypothetical protein
MGRIVEAAGYYVEVPGPREARLINEKYFLSSVFVEFDVRSCVKRFPRGIARRFKDARHGAIWRAFEVLDFTVDNYAVPLDYFDEGEIPRIKTELAERGLLHEERGVFFMRDTVTGYGERFNRFVEELIKADSLEAAGGKVFLGRTLIDLGGHTDYYAKKLKFL